MNQKLFIPLLFFSLICFTNCKEDDVDCSLVDCVAPGVYLEFINKETEENLFGNGSISAEDIEISVSGLNNDAIQFGDVQDGIFIYLNAWPEGSFNASVELNSNRILEMTIHTERIEGECCSGVIITDVLVTSGDHRLVNESHIQILIENSSSSE